MTAAVTEAPVATYGAVEAEDVEERRGRVPTRAVLGIALIGLGVVLQLVTWIQIKDIQNIAAQIPYVVSGGLVGVSLAVIGGIALFGIGTRAGPVDQAAVEELAGQVRELQATVTWTADAVEQIADYLNQLASDSRGEEAPAGARSRS